MRPEEILLLGDLKKNRPVLRNTLIGPASDYGIGSGTHTHTEVKSLYEKSCFGEPKLEKIIYTLTEAMFLIEKNKMDLISRRELDFRNYPA
jgi:hypothetical protein